MISRQPCCTESQIQPSCTQTNSSRNLQKALNAKRQLVKLSTLTYIDCPGSTQYGQRQIRSRIGNTRNYTIEVQSSLKALFPPHPQSMLSTGLAVFFVSISSLAPFPSPTSRKQLILTKNSSTFFLLCAACVPRGSRAELFSQRSE